MLTSASAVRRWTSPSHTRKKDYPSLRDLNQTPTPRHNPTHARQDTEPGINCQQFPLVNNRCPARRGECRRIVNGGRDLSLVNTLSWLMPQDLRHLAIRALNCRIAATADMALDFMDASRVLLGLVRAVLVSRAALAAENPALRSQLAILPRPARRPQLHHWDPFRPSHTNPPGAKFPVPGMGHKLTRCECRINNKARPSSFPQNR